MRKTSVSNGLHPAGNPKLVERANPAGYELGICTSCCKCDIAAQH